MPQHILIVGGGVGGTIVANLLARSLHHQEAEITLIDSTGKHAYMPGWLYLPFNQLSAENDQLIRPERDLLNNHVHLVTGEVQKIDSQNRELHVHHSRGLDEIVGTGGASEAVYPYDYLVLATGARLVPSDLPGLAGTEEKLHHFYSAEGSLQLRQAKISPHLAIMRQRGIVRTERQGTEIHYSLADPRILAACRITREVLLQQLTQQASLAASLTSAEGV